jgi:hypothetical protein
MSLGFRSPVALNVFLNISLEIRNAAQLLEFWFGSCAPYSLHPAVDGLHSIESKVDAISFFLLTQKLEGVKP